MKCHTLLGIFYQQLYPIICHSPVNSTIRIFQLPCNVWLEKTVFGFLTRSDTNLVVQLEAGNFGFRQKRDHNIHEVKTKTLISCAVTAQLLCAFLFTYAKCQCSHQAAHFQLCMGVWNSYSAQKMSLLMLKCIFFHRCATMTQIRGISL